MVDEEERLTKRRLIERLQDHAVQFSGQSCEDEIAVKIFRKVSQDSVPQIMAWEFKWISLPFDIDSSQCLESASKPTAMGMVWQRFLCILVRVGVPILERALIWNGLAYNTKKNFFFLLHHFLQKCFIAEKKYNSHWNKRSI